ncbi:MAG: hypothetical protein WCL61_03910, partial [bacterium]
VVTSIKESKELPGDPNACKNLKYFNDRIFKNNTKETLSFEVTGFVDDELLINGTIYEQNLPSYAYGKCNGAHTITPYKIDMKPGDKIMINTGDNHGSRAGMDLIVTVSKKINVKFDKTTSGNPKVIILPQYKDGTKNFQTYPGIIAAEIMNDNRSIPINIELNCLSVIDKTNKLSQTWTINNGSSIGSCFEDSSASICKRASSETVPPTGLIKELYVFNINNYPAETLNCNLSLKVDNNLKDTTGGLVLFGSTFINAFSGYGKYAGSLEQNSRIIINRTDPVLTKMYVPIRDLSSDAQNASNILGLGTSYVFKEGDKAGFASQVADVCNRTKLIDQIIEKKSLPATVSDDYYDLFVKASPVAMINASTTAMVKAIVDATLYKTLQGLITGPECSAR